MNPEQNKTCDRPESLLVKKITGELHADEKKFLDIHLAQCVSCVAKEQELTREWERFESLPVPEIPTDLYAQTRETILDRLRREKSLSPWIGKIPIGGFRSLLVPLSGLAMTGISYALIRGWVNPAIHYHYVLIPLFGLWWLLFAAAFWLILKGQGERFFPLNLLAASSISTAVLTFFISFLTYEVDSVRWLAISAAYDLARTSHYLFGVGNTFVAGWWIHCCLASFIGAFIFGLHKAPRLSENLFVGSLFITILLSPGIYLQGSSHDHGYGIIAFAALGAYLGSLLGISIGLFFRRQISFQAV